jgi:RNA polymerase-interacting CarD/CdnL/TRCF family regulator
MVDSSVFAKGDWVVHVYYGVGQVIALENKCLGGKDISYYRIEGEDGTFWLPVDNADNERVRPIVSHKELQSAIQVLEEPPQELGSNHKQRQNRMKDAISKCEIIPTACLVRDLLFAQAERKLNITEEETLEKLEKNLIKEWSVVLNIKPEKVQMQLRDLLVKHVR